jgi:hypothetical protein
MRTSRLRRWMLRGALLSASAIVPLTAAAPAQADWIWQDLPPQVATPAQHQQQVDSDLAQEIHRPKAQSSEAADDHVLESAAGDWIWQ